MGPQLAGTELTVDGQPLTVRDPDRVVFPATGTTRADVLRYYAAVAGTMLPHLRDRVLQMPRYPAGVDGPCWTKPCPRIRPEWLATTRVWDPEHADSVEYCLANEPAAVLWAISVGSIELFTSLHRRDAVHRPTVMAFDLEPYEGVTLLDCCETALALRELLDAHGLMSCVKTSGIKGLHVYVPLNSEVDYAATRARAHALADRLQATMPDSVVAQATQPRLRHKVLADYRVNSEQAMLAAAYSVRAQERPTVSTPVSWDEVQGALQAGDETLITFEMQDVIERITQLGDLFAPVLQDHQTLAPELQPA